MQRIIVTGPKSSGKSTIGKQLAKLRKLQFFDLDTIIEEIFEGEEHAKLPFREIFRQKGEEKFRELEMRAIKSIDGLENILLSTGGSTFLHENSKNELIKNSYIILIHNTPEKLWERVMRKGLPAYLENSEDPKAEFAFRIKTVVDTVKPIAGLVMETGNLLAEEVARMLDYELDYRRI